MKEEFITIVEIDSSDRLQIKTQFEKFTMIYRTATEVHWDNKRLTLYSLNHCRRFSQPVTIINQGLCPFFVFTAFH